MPWEFLAYVGAAVVIVLVAVTTRAGRRRRKRSAVQRQVDRLRKQGARAAICAACDGGGRVGIRRVCSRCHGLGYVHDLPDEDIFKA